MIILTLTQFYVCTQRGRFRAYLNLYPTEMASTYCVSTIMNVLGAQKDQAHYDDQLIAKVARRLIPFLAVCYFASYLDRVNLSFAATEMTRDLYFSPQVYGWGAGIFFLGYALLEPPSNYMLHLLAREFGYRASWSVGGLFLVWLR